MDFENAVNKLTKDQLGTELNLEDREIRKLKKEELVTIFISRKNDELSKKKLYKKYSKEFSTHPSIVEELLQITPTERKRWTEQGKLKVSFMEPFTKWGKSLEYPMYDAYEISKVSNEMIEKWRKKHQDKILQNRKRAVAKALETKKKNQMIQREFYEKEWKSLLSTWFKEDEKLGTTLQLSFWTMWISRWAKENQSKSYRARTNGEQYSNRKDLLYQLKNEAMKHLIRSPFTTLSFYRPPSPHKISNIHFCADHYGLWCTLREFDYIGKWDFFNEYFDDIKKCTSCSFDKDNDYYSLFFLSVKNAESQDIHFSFHVPYPIGKSFLPNFYKLPKVHHDEQEGMFRFGRTLFEEEKIIFTEREVKKRFQDAMDKFLMYFPE